MRPFTYLCRKNPSCNQLVPETRHNSPPFFRYLNNSQQDHRRGPKGLTLQPWDTGLMPVCASRHATWLSCSSPSWPMMPRRRSRKLSSFVGWYCLEYVYICLQCFLDFLYIYDIRHIMTHTHTHVYIHTCIYIYNYIYICIYGLTHTDTYTHIYIYIIIGYDYRLHPFLVLTQNI